MKEYIERKAVIDAVAGTAWYHVSTQGTLVHGAISYGNALYKADDIYEVLDECPTADVVEVVHGEWLKSEWGYPDRTLTCSLCGFQYDSADYKTPKFNQKVLPYCPHCGARMDGERKEV